MEAIFRSLRALTIVIALFVIPGRIQAASSARTRNFIVSAPTKALANEIAAAAEKYRRELAISWLGKELPAWRDPCPVRAKVDPRLGAGGATSFLFETQQRQFARPSGDGLFHAKPKGRAFGWEMSVQGSRERVLDSVLPHEVTHTIFATHFGRPLPRWADEGACTTVEHESEKRKQDHMLHEFLTTERGIPFNRMFAMTEYPDDILPLYSQGYSLARFLILQGGRRKFVDYVGEGLDSNDWSGTTMKHYGYESISDLQLKWLDWVRQGSRRLPDNSIRAMANQSTTPARTPRAGAAPQPSQTPRDYLASSSLVSAQSNKGSVGTDSWYLRQRQSARGDSEKLRDLALGIRRRNLELANMATEQPTPTNKVAHSQFSQRRARPDAVSHQREVLLEWGKPNPILSPRLLPQSSEPRHLASKKSEWLAR